MDNTLTPAERVVLGRVADLVAEPFMMRIKELEGQLASKDAQIQELEDELDSQHAFLTNQLFTKDARIDDLEDRLLDAHDELFICNHGARILEAELAEARRHANIYSPIVLNQEGKQ